MIYYRTSGHRPLLLRSRIILQRLKPLLYKDFMNINLTVLLESASSQFMPTPKQVYGVGLLAEEAK